jgi:hypothetical protein
MPREFDAPLAPHHRLIGRWVAEQDKSARKLTRAEARRHIERRFAQAVQDILHPINIAELRVVALIGDEAHAPALAVICDTVGAIDLGWIETSNVLANTMLGPVAPMRWQAAAYKALTMALPSVLPIFGYDELFEHISAYYWDGATDDLDAVKALTEWHGADPDDIDEEMLPSAMNARRPAWMLAKNASPLQHLSPGLRDRIRRVRAAEKAVRAARRDSANAWHFDFHLICEYVDDYEDSSTLPPLTLVPADHFARELDDAGRQGMETSFIDVAGLCPLRDDAKVADWFASLRLGVELLLAAQDLIASDPMVEARP